MKLNTFRGSRFAAAALLALSAIAIGSIFGAAGSGSATIAVAPSNTAVPTISGTNQSGSTLTATSGTWSGTTPLNFTYAWSRCDKNGASCAAIGSATSSTYVLQNADNGNTIRVTVTASNGDGSAQAAIRCGLTVPPELNGLVKLPANGWRLFANVFSLVMRSGFCGVTI